MTGATCTCTTSPVAIVLDDAGPCAITERHPDATYVGAAHPSAPALRIAYSVSAATSVSEVPGADRVHGGIHADVGDLCGVSENVDLLCVFAHS
jgi:hypothetical protein